MLIDDCVNVIADYLPLCSSMMFAQASKSCYDIVDGKHSFLRFRNIMTAQLKALKENVIHVSSILDIFRFLDENSLYHCGLMKRLAIYHLIRILGYYSKLLQGPRSYYQWEKIFNNLHDYFIVDKKEDFYIKFRSNDVLKLGYDFKSSFMSDWKNIECKFTRGYLQDILFYMELYPLLKSC